MFKERVVNPNGLQMSTSLNPKGEVSNVQLLNKILKGKEVVTINHTSTDDFGPQRYCRKCGHKVKEMSPGTNNSRVSYWHFGRNQLFPGMTLPPIGVRGQMSLTYKEDVLIGWECPEHGILDNNDISGSPERPLPNKLGLNKELDMDDIRDAYKSLKGKDAEWLHDNAKIVKQIYVDHADDVGRPKRDITATELSPQEQHVFGTLNERTGKHNSVVFKAMKYGYELAEERLLKAKDDLYLRDYLYFRHLIKVGVLDNNIRNAIPTFNKHVKLNEQTNKMEPVGAWEKKHHEYIMTWFKEYFKEFSDFKYFEEPSYKYPGDVMSIINFKYNGQYVVLKKAKKATNWLNPCKLEHFILNKAIDWAREEYKKVNV